MTKFLKVMVWVCAITAILLIVCGLCFIAFDIPFLIAIILLMCACTFHRMAY
jgi:hypothetical protein